MREPYEQLTYVGSEGEIRIVDADGGGDRVFIEQPCAQPLVSFGARPWSLDGMRLAYLCPDAEDPLTLVVAGDDGRELARATGVNSYKWSPDGARVAMKRSEGEWPQSEDETPDISFEVALLDVETGEETLLAKDAWLLEWVGSDHLLLGRDLKFTGFTFTFNAYMHDLSGGSEPAPRFDGVREFWVSPDGSRAIVLQQWDEAASGFRMAVYDLATGDEREIAESAIGYGSEHIPDSLLAFSGDGTEIYWMNGNIWEDSWLYRAELDGAVTKGVDRIAVVGSVSPAGRVAYWGPPSPDAPGPGNQVLTIDDPMVDDPVEIGRGSGQYAWRTVPDVSVCSGSVAGRLEYGDNTPAMGEWIQIAGMPGDPRGEEKLVRVAANGSFRVDGVPLGFHEGYARHATFEFAVGKCGEVVDVGTVEYPLIHP